MSYVTHAKDTKKLHFRNTSLHGDIDGRQQILEEPESFSKINAAACRLESGGCPEPLASYADRAGRRPQPQAVPAAWNLSAKLASGVRKKNLRTKGRQLLQCMGILVIRSKDKLSQLFEKNSRQLQGKLFPLMAVHIDLLIN